MLKNKKQEAFVRGLVKGLSQRKAYLAAFGQGGMSLKTIDEKACRLFHQGKIQARYQELMEESKKKAAGDVDMRAWIISQYRAMAAADPLDYYVKQDGEEGEGRLEVKENIKDLDGRPVKRIYYDRSGNLSIEFYDKQQALSKLAEIYQVTEADKEQAGVEVVLPPDLDGMSD